MVEIEPQYKPIEQTEKHKIQEAIEVEKLKKELESQKMGFKDFAAFIERQKQQELKEVELLKRQENIETQEQILLKREEEVVRGGEINERVKENLISKELMDYKKIVKVRKYAIDTYFNNLVTLFQKLRNARVGKDVVGLVKHGKIIKDESVCMDETFLVELLPIIEAIEMALKYTPKFSEEGEYLTPDETENLEENPEEFNNNQTET